VAELIALQEHQERELELAPEDADYIERTLALPLTRLHGGSYRVNPKQHVGVVTLPSGTRLESRPKIGLRNVLYLMSVAYDQPPLLDEMADFAEFADMLEVVAAFFASMVEERLRVGLYRSYLEEEANLPLVRGRIVFAEDARLNFALRHRTYCRFSEFSWDVPENQVLRQVVQLLAGWDFTPELRVRLSRLDSILDEVTPVAMAPQDVSRFRYHRLNASYQPIHRLCQLFLAGSSATEGEGDVLFQGFLVDMNQLFELFVTAVLKEHRPAGVSVRDQVRLYLGEGQRLDMRADLVIRCGNASIVADCKYKATEPGQQINTDYYQVLAYCTSAGAARGLLLYPKHELPTADDLPVVNSSVRIGRLNIDLNLDWKLLRGECQAFAGKVFSYLQVV
jgi:5-methylcytosine-specific restriction enzyme subunit McrC